MNPSNLTLHELKKLKHDIEDEIALREEREYKELLDLIKSYLVARQWREQAVPGPTNSPSNKNLMGVDELAERLNVKRSHIYSLTNNGRIPVVKVRKYSRYDYDKVLDALNNKNE